jgi:dolichol-phosphate mannosyltransferase
MLLSVVIPLLNEKDNLRELHRRLATAIEPMGCEREIILVDDGSTDGSDRVIRELCAEDPTVTGLRFSRNFGHEAATTAGLDAASGDATVIMDADLQDPPELLADMHRLWKAGNEIVYAVRRRRAGESKWKLSAAWIFYRALNLVADVPIPLDAGDFRLMDRRVVESLRKCRERDRFVRGLIAWTGFRTTAVGYDRPARFSGESHYGLRRLFFLSLDAFFGFSIVPLRLASAAGIFFILASALAVTGILVEKLAGGHDPSGWMVAVCGIFFVGGVQLLCSGILGEYIGRIYRQGQDRPLYLVAEEIGKVRGAGRRENARAAA